MPPPLCGRQVAPHVLHRIIIVKLLTQHVRRLLGTHQWQSALLVVGLPVTQDWFEMGCHLPLAYYQIVHAVPPSQGRGWVNTHTHTHRFIRSYMRLFTQTGQYYRDTGNAISREQFKNGCALFAFDLTPQLDSAQIGFELIKHGNIRIEIHFADAVAQTLTAAVFAETITYWKLITIDKLRSITQHEQSANRRFVEEGFSSQENIQKNLCIG